MECSFHFFSLFEFQWSDGIPLNPARMCQASLSLDLTDVEAMIAIIFSVCVLVVFASAVLCFHLSTVVRSFFFLNLPL